MVPLFKTLHWVLITLNCKIDVGKLTIQVAQFEICGLDLEKKNVMLPPLSPTPIQETGKNTGRLDPDIEPTYSRISW